MANTTLTRSQIDEFMTILNRLSPENLFQDGELPRAAALRVERKLKALWKVLEQEVGRSVTEDEVWAAFVSTPRSSRVGATVRA